MGKKKFRMHFDAKIKPSVLDFSSELLVLVDLRDADAYRTQHIRQAINIPAQQWMERSEEDFAEFLQTIHFDKLLRHHSTHSSRQDDEGTLREMKDALGINQDSHLLVLYHQDSSSDSQQQVADMLNLFRKVLQEGFLESEPDDAFAKYELYMLRKGFNELDQRKYGRHMYEGRKDSNGLDCSKVGWKQSVSNLQTSMISKNPQDMVYSVLPGILYYGPARMYYQYAESQSKKTSEEILKEANDNRRSTDWKGVNEIFDLRPHTSLPDYIVKNADSTQSYGMRVVTEVVTKETKKGWGLWGKKKTKAIVREQTRDFVEDSNVIRTTYTFDNGFSFTVSRAKVDADMAVIFSSILHCIEGCTTNQEAILIQPGPYSIAVVLAYLVHLRKWSIRRGFKFIFKNLPKELIALHSETLIEPIRNLLDFERVNLPHVFPSIPFRIIVLFHLNMEPDLDVNLRQCKKVDIVQLEDRLFAAIKSGDCERVISSLTHINQLCLSRTSLKEDDATPLIVAMRTTNPAVRSNKACLDLLAPKYCVNLSDKYGRDALYYAIEAGESYTREVIRRGALVTTCSKGVLMNPLQRALKYMLSYEILELLTDRETVNHRDLFLRTPCHYAIDSSYPDSQIIQIIGMFQQNGVNLHLTDADGYTPKEYAVIRKKSERLCKYLNDIVNEEGVIRHSPYQSYAPLRQQVNVHYYIDGQNYYAALAIALREAKRSIYIAGWWLTPEIYLTRHGDHIGDRLDRVIKEVAERGVQVRILLWENFEQAENIKNDLAAKKMENLSVNIKAMTHTSSFIDGYTHHQKIVCIDEYDAFVGGLDLCLHRWDQQSHPIYPGPLYVGKDYFNSRFLGDSAHQDNDVAKPKHDYIGLVNRDIPRSGWHDIHCRVDGLAAADVARNFVQRWNFVRKNRDKKYERLSSPAEQEMPFTKKPGAFQASVQVTRSISKWAVGFDLTECSIINAIKHAITTADTHVYIETQFFISVQGDSAIVNQKTGKRESLADVIINRIRKAVRHDQEFKVIIVLPMFPEGDPLDYITQRIMFWQLKTIEYIQSEVDKMTRGLPKNHADYIRFYSLGNVTLLNRKIFAEQIYIHAKLLVTDKMVICGSANLNMRSLAGSRDTEIAVVVNSREMALSLRKELWREHLGDDAKITDDFLADVPLWEEIARTNSKTYLKLFEGSCPLGRPRTKEDFLSHEGIYQNFWETIDTKKSFDTVAQMIRGHLVKFPQHFLEDDIRETNRIRDNPFNVLQAGGLGAAVVSIKEDIVQ